MVCVCGMCACVRGESCYDCSHCYEVCRLVAVFDPSIAHEKNITPQWVEEMATIVPFDAHDVIEGMVEELPVYLELCKGCVFDRTDIHAYTQGILTWWANHHKEIPAWAKAARIVFALTPNSAACERVFSLLKSMFGDQRMSALADMIQGALMLRYNNRQIG